MVLEHLEQISRDLEALQEAIEQETATREEQIAASNRTRRKLLAMLLAFILFLAGGGAAGLWALHAQQREIITHRTEGRCALRGALADDHRELDKLLTGSITSAEGEAFVAELVASHRASEHRLAAALPADCPPGG